MLWRPAAWLICGPLGHLAAGLVDLLAFALRAAQMNEFSSGRHRRVIGGRDNS